QTIGGCANLPMVLSCCIDLESSRFFFSSRRRHTRFSRDWSSDVCSSDLHASVVQERGSRGQRDWRIFGDPTEAALLVAARKAGKIGRASCRERVEISVEAA